MPPPPSCSLTRWQPLPAQLATAGLARGAKTLSRSASLLPIGPAVFRKAMGKRYIISRGGGRDLSPEVNEPSLKSRPTRGASGQPRPCSPWQKPKAAAAEDSGGILACCLQPPCLLDSVAHTVLGFSPISALVANLHFCSFNWDFFLTAQNTHLKFYQYACVFLQIKMGGNESHSIKLALRLELQASRPICLLS